MLTICLRIYWIDGMSEKIGILLVNLGTPDAARFGAVRRYLNEFLTDERVIDLPWLSRQLLVRGLIVPRRFRYSTRLYQQIWTDRGSPLLLHSQATRDHLQKVLGEDFHVVLGMRYQNPSIASALELLRQAQVDQLIVLPLFPQYASATTGSVHAKVMETLKDWAVIPALTMVNNYCTDPGFIRAFAEIGHTYAPHTYDHVLFSYHGLPERHLIKADFKGGYCLKTPGCCDTLNSRNRHCYRAQCYATTRALTEALHLNKYSICFQSRLGSDPWTQPYTEETIRRCAKQGVKRLLVFAPSFTCDCLETILEIGKEYAEVFKQEGGEELTLVRSLNTHPTWIEALKNLISLHTHHSLSETCNL